MNPFRLICIAAMLSSAQAAPSSSSSFTVILDYHQAQARWSEDVSSRPTGAWEPYKGETIVLAFRHGKASATVNSTPTQWAYTAQNDSQATLEGNGPDFGSTVTLTFTSDTQGIATETAGDEGGLGEIRNILFTLVQESDPATSSVSVDGIDAQIARIRERALHTELEKAYRKRVLELLNRIAAGEPVDTRLEAARNNTTCLHNACAICDLELVKWLTAHGADINAEAKNGATPLDCVGEDKVRGPQVRRWLRSQGARSGL